jgi:predicted DNA-binding protein
MAITSIKSTYALDAETVEALDRLSKHWGVSKSEVLRRLIRNAAAQSRLDIENPVAAWRELQASYAVTPSSARQWSREARAERRKSSTRREPGGR